MTRSAPATTAPRPLLGATECRASVRRDAGRTGMTEKSAWRQVVRGLNAWDAEVFRRIGARRATLRDGPPVAERLPTGRPGLSLTSPRERGRLAVVGPVWPTAPARNFDGGREEDERAG
jgi:hypothetical protein